MRTPGIPEDATVVAHADVLASDFENETILLSLRNGIYYGLADVGARIWTLLRSPTTVGAIRDTILQEYEVEPARCQRDLRALLEELRVKGLIDIRADRGR